MMIVLVIGYSFPLFVSTAVTSATSRLLTRNISAGRCPSAGMVLHSGDGVRSPPSQHPPFTDHTDFSYYLSTSRELKRLDAVSRSPIFAWFSESLNGLSTIRAFSQQSVFIATNERRVDRNQICYLPSISVNRWLAVRLEFVGATIIFLAATLSIVALTTSGVDAGLVGFVLSYALNTTSSLVCIYCYFTFCTGTDTPTRTGWCAL